MKRHVEATTSVRSSLTRVGEVLRDDPGCLFGHDVAPEDGRLRHFDAELEALSRAGISLAQEVEMVLGAVEFAGDKVSVPIEWHPRGHDRLLPSFHGELIVSPGGTARTLLMLRGHYEVPLGLVGRFGDGVIGHRIARQSVTDFLRDVAHNLDDEITRRMESIRFRPAPYPEDMRRDRHLESSAD